MSVMEPQFGALRAKIDAGETAIGFGIHQMRGPAPSILAAALGFDWLFIDMEHGVISQQDASQIAISALSRGITPLVRCCKSALDEGVRLLDNGAAGLVVPHVNSVDEARAVIDAVRYPPAGQRSFTSLLPHIGYQRGDWRTLPSVLNKSFLLFLMVESAEACQDAEAITALNGFDGLFIGASDLAADLGRPGQPDHPDVVDACCRVAAACRSAGRWLAFAGTRSEALITRFHQEGARMFLGGSDLGFLEVGARAALDAMQAATSRLS